MPRHEAGRLIGKHHVISHRNSHEVIHTREYEEHGKIFQIVLICIHVIGITSIDSHRNPQKLAHEVIFEPGTDHLSAIFQILRSDKTNHVIDQKRIELSGQCVASSFKRQLIGTLWVREESSEPVQFQNTCTVHQLPEPVSPPSAVPSLSMSSSMPECFVAFFAAGDALKIKPAGAPLSMAFNCVVR